MRTYRIAAIPGDGIGVEVIAAGLRVPEVLAGRDGGLRIEAEHFPWSRAYYRRHGYYSPADGLARLRGFDAIFFGALGAPDPVSLWGPRLPICRGIDPYANVHPARLMVAIEAVCARRLFTPDLGGEATTGIVTEAVCDAL